MTTVCCQPGRNLAPAHGTSRYAAPMPTTAGAASKREQQVAFAAWLRLHMETSGYATQGAPRPGGLSRLAADTGLSPSILSRALNAQSVPQTPAVLELARTLGASPTEALRAAGQHDLAEELERTVAKGEAHLRRQSDPALDRIERATGLTDSQRAYLAGFYQRRIEAARKEAAKEITELIELLERRADTKAS